LRTNDQLDEAYARVDDLQARAAKCSLSDTGNWTNQNVVFTKALIDMFPLAKTILKGARQRDECRGAHYKPDFDMPGIESTDPTERRKLAEEWCDRFEENNQKWLKTTVASLDEDGEPQIVYEDVNTGSIPPRPRLYGKVGGDIIEEVWKERSQAKLAANGNGAKVAPGKSAAVTN
jgi:succinate dehydrogenase / fumarate reductase flavoprotein subunit